MKVYWNRRSAEQAEIVKDIEKNNAKPWEKTIQKSHILIGDGQIFIHSPDYHIDGYSLSTQDLADLLSKLTANIGLIICDGCNVKEPLKHKCHKDGSFVNGEATGKSCECPECSANAD